jgi:hypothetical protein
MQENYSLYEVQVETGRSYRQLLRDIRSGALKAGKDDKGQWLVTPVALADFRERTSPGSGFCATSLLSEATGGEVPKGVLDHMFDAAGRVVESESDAQASTLARDWKRQAIDLVLWLKGNPYHPEARRRVKSLTAAAPTSVKRMMVADMKAAMGGPDDGKGKAGSGEDRSRPERRNPPAKRGEPKAAEAAQGSKE